METSIICAAISAAAAIIVGFLSNNYTQRQLISKSEQTMKDMLHTQQEHEQDVLAHQQQTLAIVEYKLDALTKEVREHNNFARRMPVVEEQIKAINHRVDALENAE